MLIYLLLAFTGDEVPGIILPKDYVDVPILQVAIADTRKYATYLECTKQADTKRDMLVYIGPKGPSCDSWAETAKKNNWQFCHEDSFAGFNYGPNRLTWDGKQWCFNPNQPTGDAKYAPSELVDAEKKSQVESFDPSLITQDTTALDADETNTESQDTSETEAISTDVPDAASNGVTSVEVVSEAGRQGCGVNGCSLQYSGVGVRRSYSEEETIIDGGGGGGMSEVAFSSRKSMKKSKKSAKKAVKHEFKATKHARRAGRHRARFAAFSGGGC